MDIEELNPDELDDYGIQNPDLVYAAGSDILAVRYPYERNFFLYYVNKGEFPIQITGRDEDCCKTAIFDIYRIPFHFLENYIYTYPTISLASGFDWLSANLSKKGSHTVVEAANLLNLQSLVEHLSHRYPWGKINNAWNVPTMKYTEVLRRLDSIIENSIFHNIRLSQVLPDFLSGKFAFVFDLYGVSKYTGGIEHEDMISDKYSLPVPQYLSLR